MNTIKKGETVSGLQKVGSSNNNNDSPHRRNGQSMYNSFDDEYGTDDGNNSVEYIDECCSNDTIEKQNQRRTGTSRGQFSNNNNNNNNRQKLKKQYRYRERIPSKIPLPIGIELYNMFWMNRETVYNDTTTSNSIPGSKRSTESALSTTTTTTITTNPTTKGKRKWRYQREYKSHLLHRVQLEIYIHSLDDDDTDYHDYEEEENYNDDDDVYVNYNDNNCDPTSSSNNSDSTRSKNDNNNNSSLHGKKSKLRMATAATTTTKNQHKKRRRPIYHDVCKLPPTINPSWRHLNEFTTPTCIMDDNNNNNESHKTYDSTADTIPIISYENLSNDEYITMTARISILPDASIDDDDTTRYPTNNDDLNRNTFYGTTNDVKPTTKTTTTTAASQGSGELDQSTMVVNRSRYDSYDFFYNDTVDNGDTSRNFDDPSVLFQQIHLDDQQQQQQDTNINQTQHLSSNVLPLGTMNATKELSKDCASKYIVIDVPIHPSKLIRIGSIPTNLPLNCIVVYFSDGSIRVQPTHYQLLYESNQYGVVVSDQPPPPIRTSTNNSIYSNSNKKRNGPGSKAVTPALSQQSSFDAATSAANNKSISGGDDASTNTTVINFDDDAFAALDNITSTNANKKVVNQQKKLYHKSSSDDLFPDVLASDTDYNDNSILLGKNNQLSNHAVDLYSSYDTDTTPVTSLVEENIQVINKSGMDYVTDGNENRAKYPVVGKQNKDPEHNQETDPIIDDELSNDIRIVSPMENTVHCEIPVEYSEHDINLFMQTQEERELLLEQRRLQQLLEEEELGLESDINQLKNRLHNIRLIKRIVDQVDEQVMVVAEEVSTEHSVRQQYEFLTDSQRIRLISELSIIYNISIATVDRRYFIRGIEIPRIDAPGTAGGTIGNNGTTSVSDDDLSAALGYLCHTVSLLSLYLNVHLRYKLIYYPSRSYVVDIHVVPTSSVRFAAAAIAGTSPSIDTNKVGRYDGQYYPLFYGRGIVGEQCEYAVYLLNCNVDCICRSRNIRIAANSHILAKVKRIYECVIDGY